MYVSVPACACVLAFEVIGFFTFFCSIEYKPSWLIYIYIYIWEKSKNKVIKKWWIFYEGKSALKPFDFNEPSLEL